MKWEKGTFTPTLNLCGPIQPLPAYVSGEFAVRRAFNRDGFVVSYIPLGLICGERKKLKEAKTCAEQMETYCQQHGFTLAQQKEVEKHREDLRKIALEN